MTRWLGPAQASRRVITGEAQATGLPEASADVVYGEAMLTMQGDTRRRQIVAEAHRLLRPGGRYGIHELALDRVDTNDPGKTQAIRKQITSAIHHQAYPMRVEDWAAMLEDAGFRVEHRTTLPMALLEPIRLIRDEGLPGPPASPVACSPTDPSVAACSRCGGPSDPCGRTSSRSGSWASRPDAIRTRASRGQSRRFVSLSLELGNQPYLAASRIKLIHPNRYPPCSVHPHATRSSPPSPFWKKTAKR